MSRRKKIYTGILIIGWLGMLSLMIQNYIEYPPLPDSNPLKDRMGNLEGSIYIYGSLTFIELVLGVVLLRHFFRFKSLYRVFIVAASLVLIIWSFADAMFKGGVPAGHSIWISAEFILIAVFLLIENFKMKLLQN